MSWSVPAAVADGFGSPAGHRLVLALVAAVYALSLVNDPVGTALGTAAKSRIADGPQARLLASVSQPVGMGHPENGEVPDRLARAEGTLTGYCPGDAPITWTGVLASRLAGIVGCAVVDWYAWWLGLLLLVMWLAVCRYVLVAVVRQATELCGQTTVLCFAVVLAGSGVALTVIVNDARTHATGIGTLAVLLPMLPVTTTPRMHTGRPHRRPRRGFPSAP